GSPARHCVRIPCGLEIPRLILLFRDSVLPSTLPGGDTMAVHSDHGELEAAKFDIRRSPEWPKVEKAHLAKQAHCICCRPGYKSEAGLQVHHIFPFHYCIALGRPDLELDDRNLITLCENEKSEPGEDHHLLVGHLDDFQS